MQGKTARIWRAFGGERDNSRKKSRFRERKVTRKPSMLPQTNLLKCMRSSWQFPFKLLVCGVQSRAQLFKDQDYMLSSTQQMSRTHNLDRPCFRLWLLMVKIWSAFPYSSFWEPTSISIYSGLTMLTKPFHLVTPHLLSYGSWRTSLLSPWRNSWRNA